MVTMNLRYTRSEKSKMVSKMAAFPVLHSAISLELCHLEIWFWCLWLGFGVHRSHINGHHEPQIYKKWEIQDGVQNGCLSSATFSYISRTMSLRDMIWVSLTRFWGLRKSYKWSPWTSGIYNKCEIQDGLQNGHRELYSAISLVPCHFGDQWDQCTEET